MDAIFGAERASKLEEKLKGIRAPSARHTAREREELILEALIEAMGEIHKEIYVRPYRFKKRKRTTHMLIFVTKSLKGYKEMKNAMARESTLLSSSVPSFTFSDTPGYGAGFFDVELLQLQKDLCDRFANRTLTMDEIYQKHNVGTDYIERNYKDALNELEKEGKISADPPAAKRRPYQGKPSFGPNTSVTFPPRKK